jgi:16S rRNA (guanine527-N7)-methyltransferase
MQALFQETKDLLGIELTSAQLANFETYAEELAHWNKKISLTAITDPDEIRVKHFLDSLSCLLVMGNPSGQRVVDVGTGAGFPGLPLKIVYPAMQLTLVESVGKKADFLRHIADLLQLENIQMLNLRAEDLGRRAEHRESYDWALARAVAALPALAEYLLPLVKVGGRMLAQKGAASGSAGVAAQRHGSTAFAEAEQAENAIQILGGEVEQILPAQLPGIAAAPQPGEERYLVVIKKVRETPEKYPRRAGMPAKRPL